MLKDFTMSNVSNSKLTPMQNDDRKDMKAGAKRDGVQVFHFTNFGYTLAVRQMGANNVAVAVACMAENEQKYRRKVGEYYALSRWFDAQTVTVRSEGRDIEQVATDFVDGLMGYTNAVAYFD